MNEFQTLLKKYTNQHSRFLSVDGTLIHYRIEGEGEPLLLLHGAFSSLHTFEEWTKRLSKKFQIIRLDLPGFALTGSVPDDDYSMKRHLHYLNSFVEILGIKKFYLGGSSLGGWVSWEYALMYPKKVKKLILIDAAGFMDAQSIPLPFKMARTPFFGRVIKYVIQHNVLEQFVREVYYNQSKITPEIIERYYELFTRDGNPEAFLLLVNNKHKENTKSLKNLAMPVLIMWGREDRWIPVRNAHRFHELIPQNRMLIYERVGHLPMEEVPVQTSKAVIKFLSEEF